MRTEHIYDSLGEGKIHYYKWLPDGEIKAVLQILHGVAEHAERYDGFANYLNALGIAVVAEDHMGHGKSMVTRGYFAGGWFTVVADSYRLLQMTMEEFPGVPYVLFGHSMGSFLARTILARHPDSGISAAIICGTGWLPTVVLKGGKALAQLICKIKGEKTTSNLLHSIMFGSYHKRIEHPRTSCDWISRDDKVVDAYVADPLCGFVASAGLVRDMLTGILYIQRPDTLQAMKKELPVFFIAGGDDPVGDYGDGVCRVAAAFQDAGMLNVSQQIYPLCRHEILSEINKEEVYDDIARWLKQNVL